MDRLSNAQQIKELYKELLADSQEHTRIESVSYTHLDKMRLTVYLRKCMKIEPVRR